MLKHKTLIIAMVNVIKLARECFQQSPEWKWKIAFYASASANAKIRAKWNIRDELAVRLYVEFIAPETPAQQHTVRFTLMTKHTSFSNVSFRFFLSRKRNYLEMQKKKRHDERVESSVLWRVRSSKHDDVKSCRTRRHI